MNEGGIICKVREDLVEILLDLKKKYTGANKIDYILIETNSGIGPPNDHTV